MADPAAPPSDARAPTDGGGDAELDPALLARTLSPLAPELADLPAGNPRLDEVARLVGKGQYPAAAARAAVHLAAGVQDWRLVGPYLFGVFNSGGMTALPTVFDSLLRALGENLGALGPASKQSVAIENGLRWLLRTLTRNLDFHERAKDDTWSRWCEPAGRAGIEDALALAGDIEAAIARVLPDSRSGCSAAFERVVTWLRELGVAVQTQVVAVPQADDEGDEPEKEGEHQRATLRAVPETVPMSPALAELLQRLAAFDALVAGGEFIKAGVVAADLLRTVEHFDPVRYLPSLFAGFFAGLSRQMERIEPTLQSQETLAFRALDQLYRSDLASFLKQAEGGGGDDDAPPRDAPSRGVALRGAPARGGRRRDFEDDDA